MGKLEEIDEKLEKLMENSEEKKKSFKLPWSVRMGKGKLLKKEYCIVLFIRNNGNCQIKMLPIQDNTISFGDYIYDASSSNILRYRKYPMIIVKEFDMVPISLKKESELAEQRGTLTSAERYVYIRRNADLIKPKMKINAKVVVMLLLVLGGGYFVLSSMGLV